MSTSTNGEISFGILFDEGFEFPWQDEDGNDEIEDWWRKVNGFVDVHQPWTPEGEWAEGFSENDPRYQEYRDARSAWGKAHPLPIELVNCCSCDCPQYILAYPGSVKTAYRGSPVEIGVELDIDPNAAASLVEFCKKYGIEHDPEYSDLDMVPKWWLSSYWG